MWLDHGEASARASKKKVERQKQKVDWEIRRRKQERTVERAQKQKSETVTDGREPTFPLRCP